MTNWKEELLKKWKDLPVKKQQQYSVFALCSLALMGVSTSYAFLKEPSIDSPQKDPSFFDQPSKNITLSTAKNALNPNLTWKQQVESDQKSLQKELEEIKNLLKNKPSQEAPQTSSSEIEALKAEIAAL
jgi:hypothetical protein